MTSVETLGRRILAANHATWVLKARSLRRQPTHQAVHDMRVAGRKLRAALKLFKKFLPAERRRLAHPLAKIGAQLGAVRDLDVHLVYLNRVQRQRATALAPYHRYVEDRLKSARRDVQRLMRAPVLKALDQSLRKLWENGSFQAPEPAWPLAHKQLKKQSNKLQKIGWRMRKDPTDALIHRFRRSIRRMRYAAQFFQPLGKPSLKKLAYRLGLWQNLLGDRQDRLAGVQLLTDYLTSREKAISLPEERALLDLVKQLDRDKERLQEQILLRWGHAERRRMKHLVRRSF